MATRKPISVLSSVKDGGLDGTFNCLQIRLPNAYEDVSDEEEAASDRQTEPQTHSVRRPMIDETLSQQNQNQYNRHARVKPEQDEPKSATHKVINQTFSSIIYLHVNWNSGGALGSQQ